MLVPEVILYYTVQSLLALINKDWQDNVTNSNPQGAKETILYDLFYKDDNGSKLILNKFNYFEEAQKIFLKDLGEQRQLSISIGYNLERRGLPSIHILLPDEQQEERGIGMGEGYQPATIDDDEYQSNFTNVYRSTYNLMITSDNSSEAVLIYHALKNLMFSVFQHLEFNGLRDPKFGGQDIQFNNELVPPDIFHRNLMLSFFYESTVNDLFKSKIVKKLVPIGTIIATDQMTTQGEDVDVQI